MLKIKRVVAIIVLTLAVGLCAPQAFAGDIASPGFAGDIGTPGVNGEMPGAGFADGPTETPGFDGWIGTGLYATLASLFG